MVKCGSCGKFLAANAGVKCSKCSTTFHRGCVLPEGSVVGNDWACPGCLSRTPAKGRPGFYTPEARASPAPADIETNEDLRKGESLNLAQEIRAFRLELSALRAEVRECRQDFNMALKSCNDSINNLDSRISALEKQETRGAEINTSAFEDTVNELKSQLNERDQELLLNDVEISGVPEQKEESVIHIIKVLSAKLGSDVDEREIVHVERVGSARRNRVANPSGSTSADPTTLRPRNIIVRFARRATRDCLLRAARVRRVINSTDIQVGAGPPRRVYVNERLTPANKRLFYIAKQAGQQYQWKYVWTRDGKILARRDDGKPADRIRNEIDIKKVFGPAPV